MTFAESFYIKNIRKFCRLCHLRSDLMSNEKVNDLVYFEAGSSLYLSLGVLENIAQVEILF